MFSAEICVMKLFAIRIGLGAFEGWKGCAGRLVFAHPGQVGDRISVSRVFTGFWSQQTKERKFSSEAIA